MEKIYHHKLKEISPLIQKQNFAATDYMILEKVDAIEFKEYSSLKFEDWEKGTIFSTAKQLKWRRLGDEYFILLSGEDIESDEMENFIKVTSKDESVILWGWRSEKMDEDEKFAKTDYIEFQMPVRFSYPIVSKYRIALNLKIQKNDKNETVGYRFTCLSEEARYEPV